MRIGFVGAGAIAHRHLEVLASRDVDVVAVCDTDEQRAMLLRPAQARAPTPIEGRCSTPSHWMRCSCAHRPQPRRARLGGAWAGGRGVPGEAAGAGCRRRPDDRGGVGGEPGGVRRRLSVAQPGCGRRDSPSDRRCSARNAREPQLRAHRERPGDRRAAAGAGGSVVVLDPGRSGGILFELGSHDIDLQLAVAGPVESV